MPIQETIRHLDARGVPARQIARDLNISRNTVTKYTRITDASPHPVTTTRASKIDPYVPLITDWLTADRGAPRKQRHTATRIHDRLVAEE